MARPIESSPTLALRRAAFDTWRYLREVFGAALIVAVWMALWSVVIAAALQPWAPAPPPAEIARRA